MMYTENGIMKILNHYYPEETYFPDGYDDSLFLYGSTNYVWNPLCCANRDLTGEQM